MFSRRSFDGFLLFRIRQLWAGLLPRLDIRFAVEEPIAKRQVRMSESWKLEARS